VDDFNGIDDTQRDFLITQALLREHERYEVARDDVNVFAGLFKDEQGQPIRQAPFHREFQEFFTTHKRCILQAPRGHGKSVNVAIRVLWELGRAPWLRVILVSSTASLGIKLLGMMKNNIEHNEDMHRAFPHLAKINFETYDATRVQISGRRGTKKDYSIQSIGVLGSLLGTRADLVILDDVVDLRNSSTPGQRDKIVDWHDTTLAPLLSKDAREWIIGTPWDKYDFYHVMEERGVKTLKYIVEDSPDMTGTGNYLWPGQWDAERLRECKGIMTGWRFYQQYYMQDASPDTSPFSIDSLRDCYVDAGRFRNIGAVPDGYQFIHGMDLGIKQKKTSDLSAIVTIATDGIRKVIVDTRSGKWNLGEKKAMIEAVHRLYGGIFVVEDVGAQMLMIEFTKGYTRVPVVPATTTRGTKISEEFGIPSMAIDIDNGRWEIPAKPTPPQELQQLIDDMVLYNPQTHAGDRLMALYFAYAGVDMVYGGAKLEVRGTIRR
jgi:hypothetical protein